jgi:hypothetical protein
MIGRALHLIILASCVICLLTACSSDTLNHGSSVSSAPDSFASAGLGLTKTEWEQKHTLVGSSPDGTYYYDELPSPTWKGMSVYFWSEQGAPVENAPISRISLDARFALSETIGYDGRPPSNEQMERGAVTLLPADSILEKTEEIPFSQSMKRQIYFSPSLASRYPPLSSGKTPWSPEPPASNVSSVASPPDRKPGTIIVMYSHGRFVSITAGKDGIPWRYHPTPGPTQTRIPDPPYPTMPRSLSTAIPEVVPTR